ncbi:MAG TPA: hypothetical protein V6D18_16150 [Thermosynechococcaceae cyanobacterium]
MSRCPSLRAIRKTDRQQGRARRCLHFIGQLYGLATPKDRSPVGYGGSVAGLE